MKARAFLKEQLQPHLPKQWRYIDYLRPSDVLDRITIVAGATGIERLAQAPMGSYEHTVTLHLTSPNSDFGQAEDELEPALETLLLAIEDHLGTAWDPATKVEVQDRYLAWEVPVRVITSREG